MDTSPSDLGTHSQERRSAPSHEDRDVAVPESSHLAELPAVRSVYQPIVNLRTREVVAYEALARGPEGTALESPATLFAHARRHGLESALDVKCQAAAFRGALQHRLPASIPLFVNAEPRWLSTMWPSDLRPLADRARDRLQIVVEITERELIDDPAGLLHEVRRLRSLGWGVALDDVGADPASLTLMPLIDPDVIKLDLRLIQEHHSADASAIVNAAIAQAERSNAIILAEGIETEEHLARALAMGATLGQGWLFGRPGELPQTHRASSRDLSFTREAHQHLATPFEAIRDHRPVQQASKRLLLPMSHHLERHPLRTSEKPLLLATFEDATHFTPATATRYAKLVEHCSFVGALGVGMTSQPAPGVRGAHISDGDRLRGEWVVCVVGPHFAGALIANDLGDDGPDSERRFEAAVSYNRDLVLDAARSLVSRIQKINGGCEQDALLV